MAVRFSALRAGRSLPHRKMQVLISVKRLSRPQGHSAAGRIRSVEKSSDLIGNRTRDFPACSIMPQPTTLPLCYCESYEDAGKLTILISSRIFLGHFPSIRLRNAQAVS
jgi:hypothetical protein